MATRKKIKSTATSRKATTKKGAVKKPAVKRKGAKKSSSAKKPVAKRKPTTAAKPKAKKPTTRNAASKATKATPEKQVSSAAKKQAAASRRPSKPRTDTTPSDAAQKVLVEVRDEVYETPFAPVEVEEVVVTPLTSSEGAEPRADENKTK